MTSKPVKIAIIIGLIFASVGVGYMVFQHLHQASLSEHQQRMQDLLAESKNQIRQMANPENKIALSNGPTANIVIGQPDFTTKTTGSGNDKLSNPYCVVLDSAGNLLVADAENHRILRFSAPLKTGMSADLVIGQLDFSTVSAGANNNKLSRPHCMVLDSAGNLFVTDTANDRILRFSAPLKTGMSSDLVIGQPDFSTVSAGASDNKLSRTYGITLDGAGNLFVVDVDNNRVLRFSAPLKTGMSADLVIGQPDFSTVSAGSGSDKLSRPHYITLDSAGNLLVTDAENNRVLRFSAPLKTGMSADLVIGQPDFSTVSAGSGSDKLSNPVGLSLDSTGNLLVADGFNNRILRFSAPLKTGMSADLVIGQPDFSTTTAGASDNKFYGPVDIARDSAGNLLVADLLNHRILQFSDIS